MQKSEVCKAKYLAIDLITLSYGYEIKVAIAHLHYNQSTSQPSIFLKVERLLSFPRTSQRTTDGPSKIVVKRDAQCDLAALVFKVV